MHAPTHPFVRIAARIAWAAAQLAVAVLWFLYGFGNAVEIGLADAGTPAASVPHWSVSVLFLAPIAGSVFWIVQYLGTKSSRRQRQIVARLGLAVAVIVWGVALLVAGAHYGFSYYPFGSAS